VLLPVGATGGTDDLVVSVTLAQSTVLLAGGGESAELSVLVDGLAQPVDAGIVADALVGGVHHDDFEVFVSRVLGDPVRVHDSKSSAVTSGSLLSGGSQ